MSGTDRKTWVIISVGSVSSMVAVDLTIDSSWFFMFLVCFCVLKTLSSTDSFLEWFFG